MKRLLAPLFALALFLSASARAASDFQYDPGTNGFGTIVALNASTEMSGLASGAAVLSATVVSQTSFSNAYLCLPYIVWAGSNTPSTGGAIVGWYETSFDGGTTYEKDNVSGASTSVPALSRPTDFYIPLSPIAYANTNVAFGMPTKCPVSTAKAVIQNLSGGALTAQNHVIKLAPFQIRTNP